MWGGRGYQKSRRKEHNQLICDSEKGGRGSTNPKILRTSYIEAPADGLLAILKLIRRNANVGQTVLGQNASIACIKTGTSENVCGQHLDGVPHVGRQS